MTDVPNPKAQQQRDLAKFGAQALYEHLTRDPANYPMSHSTMTRLCDEFLNELDDA